MATFRLPLAMLACCAAAGTLAIVMAGEAGATVLGGWSANWRRTDTLEIRYRMSSWWRDSAAWIQGPVFSEGTHCAYYDGGGCNGTTSGPYAALQGWTSKGANAVLDRRLAEGEALYDYATLASPGDVFTTYLYGCCNLSTYLENNRDDPMRILTEVQLAQDPAFGALPYGSPQLLAPLTFLCERNVPCDFDLPALALEGRPLRFEWAASGSAGSYLTTQVPGSALGSPATLDPMTGHVHWADPPLTGFYIAAAEVVYDDDPGTAAVTANMITFNITVRDTPVSDRPSFTAGTPADGSLFDVPLGSTLVVPVGGADPQSDPITIQASGHAASYDAGTGLLTLGGFTDPADLGPHLVVLSLSDEPASFLDVGTTHRSYVVNMTPTQPLVDVTAGGVVHVSGPNPPRAGEVSVYDVTIDTGSVGPPFTNFIGSFLELEFPLGDALSVTTIASTLPFTNETILADGVRWTIDGTDSFGPQSFTFRVIVLPPPGSYGPVLLTPGVTLTPDVTEPYLQTLVPSGTTGPLASPLMVPALGPGSLALLAGVLGVCGAWRAVGRVIEEPSDARGRRRAR